MSGTEKQPHAFAINTEMTLASAKQSKRGRKQDRTRVAGAQDYELRYESRKTGASKKKVAGAVRKVGNRRRRVEPTLTH